MKEKTRKYNPIKIEKKRRTNYLHKVLKKDFKKEIDTKSDYFYLLFIFENLKNEYGVNFHDILLIIYLKSIGVIGKTIKIQNRIIYSKHYERIGLLELRNDGYYQLSKISNSIVYQFQKNIGNISDYKPKDDDLGNQISDILSDYY